MCLCIGKDYSIGCVDNSARKKAVVTKSIMNCKSSE